MFRKFFAAAAAVALIVGGLFAEEFKGVFKKYEDGKATVEIDGKEKTFKVSPDAKIKNKKGEVLVSDFVKNLKEGMKGTFTVEDGVITKVAREKKTK